MTGALAIKAPQPTGGDGVASLTTVAAESGRAISRITNAGDSGSGPYLIFRKDRGTLAAPALLKSGDELGFVRFNVASGTSERNVGTVAAYAMSNAVTTGCDTRLQLQSLASDPAKPAAFLTLDNYTATGRVFQVGSDNFSVGVVGMTIAGAVAGTLATNGIAGSFRSNGNGNGQTGIGVLGAAAGTSATSGGVTGVRGEVTGTVSTGIGVSSDVTATATQNYGFATTVRGGTRNIGLYVDVPKAAGSYAIQFQGDADSYFKSNVGIGWATPTVLLEVGGATKLRSTLEVVGNITSAGTAHNFAAKSIPASAINGVPTLKADDLTDVTVTTPAAGQVLRWNGTNFVNAALNYSDLTGTAPGGGMTQADADNRYVNITGDTMTGDLIVNAKLGVGVTPLTGFHVKTPSIFLEGFTNTTALTATAPSAFGGNGESLIQANATVSSGSYTAVLARTRGTDNNPSVPRVGDFAFRSDGPAPSQLGGDLTVSGKLIGDRPYVAVTSSYDLTLAARSATIANVSTGAATVTISIPLNSSAAFAIGSRLEILDLSATSATVISAVAGVTLNWNASLTSGAPALAGGAGASVTLPTPISRVTLIKTGTDTWVVLN
jgi:hypothetical protein